MEGGKFVDFIASEQEGKRGLKAIDENLKTGADLLFKYRGFSLITEFVKTKAIINNDINFRRNRYNNDNPDEITNNLPLSEMPYQNHRTWMVRNILFYWFIKE